MAGLTGFDWDEGNSTKSWDRHQIPKPGSEVAIAIGAPIEIAGTDQDTIEKGRQELETVLGRLKEQALRMVCE